MTTYSWYESLIKPSFAPPAWLFGPVWSFLYLLIALSFGYVFYLYLKKKINKEITAPFVLNLVFNFLFTPIQFGLRNNVLAFVDVFFVWVTLLWLIKIIWPVSRKVALIQIPYLLWVSFATFLQLSITILNW